MGADRAEKKRGVGIKSLADFLDVSEATVKRWIDERRLPVYRPGGERGRIVWYPEEVKGWESSSVLGE